MLLLLIFFPMVMAFVCYGVGRYSKKGRSVLAIATGALVLGLSVFLAFGENRTQMLSQVCSLGLHLELDGFRKAYCVIISLMWCMTLLLSDEYFAHYHNRRRYYFFNLLTLGATLGVFLAADLFTAFIFFEIMSFTSYTWVLHEENSVAIRAANTYLAVAVIGGLVALMGLFLLQNRLGTTEISKLYALAAACPQKASLYVAGGCILFGFGAKAGMFPLHIWLPKAHPVAPAPASALLSGVLTKSGVWGIVAISASIFRYDPVWGKLILALGTITMVLGAVLALMSIDLKRTLACSSMSQIGFVLVGVGMMGILGEENALAARGALLHMMNHSLFKLVLFSCAGVVFMNLHKLDLNDIRGFGRKKPLLNLCFLLGAAGIAGVPGLNGYVSKTLLHEAIVEGGSYGVVEWLFLISGGLTAAYMTKLYICLFVEKNPERQAEFDSCRRYMNFGSTLSLLIPALCLPVLGLTVGKTMDAIATFGTDFFHPGELAHKVPYFSLENLKGGFISLAIGAVVYLFVVRKLLMKDGCYVNFWPEKLDLEDRVYRPLLLKILPDGLGWFCALFGENKITAPIFRWILRWPLGMGSDMTGNNRLTEPFAKGLFRALTMIGHAFIDLPDALVWGLRATIFKESRIHSQEKALESLPYRLGDRVDHWEVVHGKENPDEHRYARLIYRGWHTLEDTTRRISGNLSFALLMLCVAVCIVLLYVIGYRR